MMTLKNLRSPADSTPRAARSVENPIIGVLRTRRAFRVVAMRPIPAGAFIMGVTGIVTHRPTRFSLQVSATDHISVPPGLSDAEAMDAFPWRFLNHACEPNARISHDQTVVAVRAIMENDEVTFNYNTTEYDMAAPFACQCGTVRCVGVVRGARHLDAEQLAHLHTLLSPYLVGPASRLS